jgi:hypothetical protein
MLTLEKSLRAGRFTAYRDVVHRAGKAVETHTLYLLPDTPQLARDADGGPVLHMRHYIAGHDGGDVAEWGALWLELDLAPSDAELGALRQALASELSLPDDSLELRTVPVVSGRVELTVAGERGEGELVSRIAGAGPMALAGAQRASFFAQLTAEGARLFRQTLDGDAPLLHARYELTLWHRLNAVNVYIWADLSGLPSDADERLVALQHSSASGVIIEEGAGALLSLADRTALERRATDLLRRFLEGPENATARTLSVRWTGDQVLEHHTSVSGALDVSLSEDERAARVTEVVVEHGFFAVLEVLLVAPPLPADSLVRGVTVTLVHADGAPRSYFFGPEGGQERFRAHRAATEAAQANATVQVHYRDSDQPWTSDVQQLASGSVMVLDAEEVGVAIVDVQLGFVRFERFAAVQLELEIPSLARREVMLLDRDAPQVRWQEIIRSRQRPEARYRATWILEHDERIEQPWRSIEGRDLFVDSPEAPTRSARVELVFAGSFEGIRKLVVELRPPGGTNTPALFELSDATAHASWDVPASPGQPLAFEHRLSVLYADGRHRSDDWQHSDRPVLVLRDQTLIEVTVVAKLVDLGGAWALARVELAYDDAGGEVIHSEQLTLMHRDDTPVWRFRTADPGRRSWRHRTLFVDAAGQRHQGDWRTSDAQVLVLTPPTNE